MSLSHAFDIDMATKYGIEEAILIQHFQHWISVNKRLGKNNIDGKTWSYQSQDWITAHFPYFKNRQKIQRLINSLIMQGVLIVGNFNKSAYDRTVWYAFNDESTFIPTARRDETLQQESDKNEKRAIDKKPEF